MCNIGEQELNALTELTDNATGVHKALILSLKQGKTCIFLDDTHGSYAQGEIPHKLKDVKFLFDMVFNGKPGKRYIDPILLLLLITSPDANELKTSNYNAEFRGCPTVIDKLKLIFTIATDVRVREWEKAEPVNIAKRG